MAGSDEWEEMMMNENSMYCVYMTPCKYCAKFDKWCDKECKSKKRGGRVASLKSWDKTQLFYDFMKKSIDTHIL